MAPPVTEFALTLLRHFLLCLTLLTPLELLWPAARTAQPVVLGRPGLRTDLIYFVLNATLLRLCMATVLTLLSAPLSVVVPVGVRSALGGQPIWLQLIQIVLLSEALGYLAHRLSHAVPFLWRFHAVHHSNVALDWLAAHRQHPLEAIWLLSLANLPVLIFGFSFEPLYGLILLQKLHTAFVHANVRIGWGRLTLLIASPQFHHHHHENRQDARNFASLLPIFDRLFGTYRLPDGFPAEYGIDTPMPDGYFAQLKQPFRRRD